MIIGIGVDVVGLERFEASVARTPRLLERLFAESERVLPVHSLAARFAAKEAFVKALGRDDGLSWPDIEVVTNAHGDPDFALHGGVPAVLLARGISRVHLSLSHDGGIATAFVVAEGAEA